MEEARLIQFFFGEGYVSGLYLSDMNTTTSRDEEETELRSLGGQLDFQEKLLGLCFRVSPQAFFQVNTQSANNLFKIVIDDLEQYAKPGATVVDVCCGVGVIGVCCAKLASERINGVIGVEIVPDAVEDAKFNAHYLNGLKNTEFQCARVEDVMGCIMKEKENEQDEVIAILNPPRAGVGSSCLRVRWPYIYIFFLFYFSPRCFSGELCCVIYDAHRYTASNVSVMINLCSVPILITYFVPLQAIRKCSPCKRVIYVSCNPTGSLVKDSLTLLQSESKKIRYYCFQLAKLTSC